MSAVQWVCSMCSSEKALQHTLGIQKILHVSKCRRKFSGPTCSANILLLNSYPSPATRLQVFSWSRFSSIHRGQLFPLHTVISKLQSSEPNWIMAVKIKINQHHFKLFHEAFFPWSFCDSGKLTKIRKTIASHQCVAYMKALSISVLDRTRWFIMNT